MPHIRLRQSRLLRFSGSRTPPLPGPVVSDARISIMDLREQLWDRPPSKLTRDLCSNLEINARNKQASSTIQQARTYSANSSLPPAAPYGKGNCWPPRCPEAPKCGSALAKKQSPSCHVIPFSEPGLYTGRIAFPIEHMLHFVRGQTLEDRGADQSEGIRSVHAIFSKVQNLLRNVHGAHGSLESGRAERIVQGSSRPRRQHCTRVRQFSRLRPLASCRQYGASVPALDGSGERTFRTTVLAWR